MAAEGFYLRTSRIIHTYYINNTFLSQEMKLQHIESLDVIFSGVELNPAQQISNQSSQVIHMEMLATLKLALFFAHTR